MNHEMLTLGSLMLAQRGNTTGEADASGAPATQGQPGGVDQPGGTPPRGGGMDFMFIMILMMVLMIFLMGMGGRKEKKKRAELMKGLAKYDKVQMVGGEIGTIVELNDHDVVVRVDEGSNTRIRFVRTAVQQVLKKAKDDGEVPTVEVKSEKGEKVLASRT